MILQGYDFRHYSLYAVKASDRSENWNKKIGMAIAAQSKYSFPVLSQKNTASRIEVPYFFILSKFVKNLILHGYDFIHDSL